MENKKVKHIHLSLTDKELKQIEDYCTDNAIILGQLVRRLILKEIQEKSTILSPDFIAPKIEDCLIRKRRK